MLLRSEKTVYFDQTSGGSETGDGRVLTDERDRRDLLLGVSVKTFYQLLVLVSVPLVCPLSKSRQSNLVSTFDLLPRTQGHYVIGTNSSVVGYYVTLLIVSMFPRLNVMPPYSSPLAINSSF